MFIHNVYFWLKPGLSSEDQTAFRRGLESLKEIKAVRSIHIGRPVASDRPVVESSYHWALTVLLDDDQAHDRYQSDPLHDRFREECAQFWDRVLVFDSIEESS